MFHYPILAFVALFSTAIPILAGIYRLGSIDRAMKILIVYLIFAFSIDIVTMWLIKGYWVNLGLMHIYFLIEYMFIMSIIFFWQESPKMKRLFQTLLLLYMLFWIIAKFTFEPFNGLYSLTTSVSQVLLALGAGYTLFVVMGNRVQPLISHQRFWVLLSFVLFYAGTLTFYALLGIFLHYPTEDMFLAVSINWSLRILFNILLTIGFLCPRTQP
ncbi:MAG: hypothetical protein ABSD46_06495 [Bacteroidota bacterium]